MLKDSFQLKGPQTASMVPHPYIGILSDKLSQAENNGQRKTNFYKVLVNTADGKDTTPKFK